MKKNYTLMVAMLAMVFLSTAFVSCQKIGIDELTQVNNAPQVKPAETVQTVEIINGRAANEECDSKTVSLIAGQHIDAGSVTVTNDEEFIYVTYTTNANWVLAQTHLYVGGCEAIPVNNNGNPMIGQFPYQDTHANLTTYTYQVPITVINTPDNCVCIAAHAVVKQSGQGRTETAWGQGTPINPGGSWAMKFDYCKCVFLGV